MVQLQNLAAHAVSTAAWVQSTDPSGIAGNPSITACQEWYARQDCSVVCSATAAMIPQSSTAGQAEG